MFDYEPHTLLHAGPVGWFLLLSLAGAELMALAALPVAATASRAAPSKLLRGLALAGVALLALGVASAEFVIRGAHGRILSGEPPPGGISPWMFAMEQSEAAHGLVAVALVPIALLSGAAALIRALLVDKSRRASDPGAARSLTPWLAVFAALLVTACSVGLLRRMLAGTKTMGCAIAILCEASWFEGEATAILDQTRLQIVALAAVGSLALILIARRSPQRPDFSQHGFTAASLVFALGLALFAATRAMAHDARAPLPKPEPGAARCPSDSCDDARLPPIGKCRRCRHSPSNVWGPLVELGADGPRLDLVSISGPSELAARLAERGKEWREWSPADPPPVMFAISPEMPSADVAPYLKAVRDAYRWELAVVTSQKAFHFKTNTLGVLPLSALCCCDLVRFSDDGVPLSQMPTWGALAEAAAKHADSLYIALP